MSWIVAFCRPAEGSGRPVRCCHAAALYTAAQPGLYLAVGGIPETGFCEEDARTHSGWAVVGTGISRADSRRRILTRADWGRLLSGKVFDPGSLDGHFVVVRWNGDRVECFVDQLGLRALYFCPHEGGVCISTRLDWLARTCGRTDVDLAALGSRWLMINQFSCASGVRGIERLGPGGHATFRAGAVLEHTSTPWLPSFEPEAGAGPSEVLTSLVQCARDHACMPSLGLSGGLDSRLLLAVLTHGGTSGFVTHAFGDGADPDVRLAGRITSALGVPHRRFYEPLRDVHATIALVRSFAAETCLIEPCSLALKLRYYSKLREEGRLVIDGGFGEFARRQFLKRVAKFGRSAIRSRDVARLSALMRLTRADVFSPDVTRELQAGALRGLEAALEQMPPVERIGLGNFVDLLAVRERVPNYGGPGQARLDAEILNFMPLVQPSFLRAVFGLPLHLRSNARFTYGMIRTLNPALTEFPLVKGGFTYAFGIPSSAAWLVTAVKSRFTEGYVNPGPHQLLEQIREFVLDLAHSSQVTTSPIYDAPKIVGCVERYYGGERRLRNTVDWWLTFEVWRRSLSPGEDEPAAGVSVPPV